MKFKSNELSRVFFTSDTHFGHAKEFVYKVRGYNTVVDHNEGILSNINTLVRPDDVLFHLGDFCLNTKYEEFENILSRINCKNIYFMWGNHNSCVSTVYKTVLTETYGMDDIEVYPLKHKNITFLGNYTEVTVNGKYIIMCHYPIHSWNYMKNGSWMLHGHEHSAVKDHLPEGTKGKILDVGIDYFKSPVLFEDIEKIMANKQTRTVGHH